MFLRTSRHRIFRAAVVPAAILLVTATCSTSATIERRDGPATQGRIERSDQGALYLSDGRGRLFRVARGQVEEIDHPGSVCMAVGSVISLLFLTALMSKSVHNGEWVTPVPAYGVGATGLGLLSWGGYSYFRSKSAARAYEEAPIYIRIPPKPDDPPHFRPRPPDGGAPD